NIRRARTGRSRTRPAVRRGSSSSNSAQAAAGIRDLPALLLNLVERLREALERNLVGRRGAAAGGAAHSQVGGLAHGVDHARLLGDVLDPGAVVERVHRELGAADLGGGVRRGLERIADDNRNL